MRARIGVPWQTSELRLATCHFNGDKTPCAAGLVKRYFTLGWSGVNKNSSYESTLVLKNILKLSVPPRPFDSFKIGLAEGLEC
jgi:hypothetical protein